MSALSLRAYDAADEDALGALFGDPEVMRYVGDGRPVERGGALLVEKILRVYQTDPSFFVWAIVEDGEYAGHAELKRRAGRAEYELIYILPRERWGRGRGGRVVDLLLLEAHRRTIPFVLATVAFDNAASIAILKRRGFVRDDALSQELECEAFRLDLTPERIPARYP